MGSKRVWDGIQMSVGWDPNRFGKVYKRLWVGIQTGTRVWVGIQANKKVPNGKLSG